LQKPIGKTIIEELTSIQKSLKPIKIYLAGPLFSLFEKHCNKQLAIILEKKFNCSVILPQEGSIPFEGLENFADLAFQFCIEEITQCDLLLAILEGPDVDSGTSVEIGYAYSLKKPILGIRTDLRASEDQGVNLMISKACSKMIWNKGIQDMEALADELIQSIMEIKPEYKA
jgi:nucleoside 2-deoxyribosyltransferase